jgi:hypothetical protein
VQFYQQGVTAKGVAPEIYPYLNYMQFLRNWGLITWPDAAGVDPPVTLTNTGSAFLTYIEQSNYNVFERPY